MPSRPKHPCGKPGCPGLARAGEKYCERHPDLEVEERRESSRQYNRTRPTAAQRGYGAAWRAVRARVLADVPNCQNCGAAGRPDDHVDHVLPVAKGGTNERENLRRVCKPCHSSKTASRDGGFGN